MGEEKIYLMAEMRTSYGELMTNCWQVADNLWHHFSVYCIELSTISKTSQSAPTSADFLPRFWHRSGTEVAISWRKKMSSNSVAQK